MKIWKIFPLRQQEDRIMVITAALPFSGMEYSRHSMSERTITIVNNSKEMSKICHYHLSVSQNIQWHAKLHPGFKLNEKQTEN